MENINIWWEGPFDNNDIINGEIKKVLNQLIQYCKNELS